MNLKIRLSSYLVFTAFIIFSVSSCQKELSSDLLLPVVENIILENLPVVLSVTGKVLDENQQPVAGASVSGGGKNTTTDASGKFRLTNGNFNGNYATVKIEKNNYFTLVKTFVSKNGNTDFIVAQISPKVLIGKMGASGGILSYAGGKVTLGFPANAFVNVSGTPFTDSVNIYATYLDPTSPTVNSRMPGNLMGVDRPSTMYVLETFGMIAVEMSDAANQKINIAPGKKVTITSAIPPSLQTAAPATVPLWFFDESNGVWVKEGEVIKNGTVYSGDVSHFTFWNIDISFFPVFFQARFLNASDSAALAYKSISFNQAGSTTLYYEYTDSAGYTAGYLPQNMAFRLRFYRNDLSVALDTVIGPYSNLNNNIGNIYVNDSTTQPPPPPPPQVTVLTGTVLNCNGQPVSNGIINLQITNQNYSLPLNGGTFNIGAMISPNTFIIITGMDSATNAPISDTILFTGSNLNIGNIFACASAPEQFISYNLDGTDHMFVRDLDSAFCTKTMAFNRTNIACRRATGSPTIEGYVAFITGPSSVGGTDTSSILTLHQFTTASTPSSLNIISFTESYYEYPPAQGVEGWVNGKFTCVFRDQLSTLHTITSHFKMWRRN